MLYRIITEDCGNTPAVLAIVNKHLDCYTYSGAVGSWKGRPEPSLVIEVDDLGEDIDSTFSKVYNTAHAIKTLNKQDSVLVQEILSNSKLIQGGGYNAP